MKILAQARTGLNAIAAGFRQQAPRNDAMPDVYGVQGDQPETQAQANIPNPDGWSDKFKLPDEPPKSRMNNGGIDPGFRAGAPDQGQQWSSRPGYQVTPVGQPKYGPQNPVLTDDQAHVLQLLWMVTGQNADTVGRGRMLQFSPDWSGEQYRENERDASTDQYGDVTDRGQWQIDTTGEAQVLHQEHQMAPPSQPAAPRNVQNGLNVGTQSGDGVTPDQKNDKLSRMGQALME